VSHEDDEQVWWVSQSTREGNVDYPVLENFQEHSLGLQEKSTKNTSKISRCGELYMYLPEEPEFTKLTPIGVKDKPFDFYKMC